MLKAVQTTLEKGEEKKEMSLYDWYTKVLEDDKVMKMGFHVVSRLRHDAALFYTWDGEPTGKPGRPRIKGDKIDVRNIDISKVNELDLGETKAKPMRSRRGASPCIGSCRLSSTSCPTVSAVCTSLRMRA